MVFNLNVVDLTIVITVHVNTEFQKAAMSYFVKFAYKT